MKIPNHIALSVLLLIFLLLPGSVFSQHRGMKPSGNEIQKTEREQPKSRKVKKAEAKAAAAKEKEETAYKKAKEQDMKHRMDLQTPATKKRMKESKKKAEENNDHYRQSLWGKIFGRKR